MQLTEVLAPERIAVNLDGDPRAVIMELARLAGVGDRADEILALTSADAPTARGYDALPVAIPHARLPGLKASVAALGLADRPLTAGGARVVLLLLTPDGDPAEHLKLLGGLTSLLHASADRLQSCRDAATALEILAAEEARTTRASYYNLSHAQLAFELQTDLAAGLSSTEAHGRMQRYGANELRKTGGAPWYRKLLRNFVSFFAALLWTAALLCYAPGVDMPQLGHAIIIVILLNGIFSFLQERKSDRAVDALQRLMNRTVRVVRDGQERTIDARSLVPGDVILLEEGDAAPADARLIEASGVEVDNSALTGESSSVRRYKTEQPIVIEGRFLWIEMPNIVFAGSTLIKGQGRAVVFGTGMQTEIGAIASLTNSIQAEESPLQKQLRGAVRLIAALAFSLGVALLMLGWFVAGLSFLQAFVFFIGIFVANVPEGLLPTVTLSLAMGVSRMAKRNALVKSLSAVETLGCTSVICSDKTGTLTQNLMMVTRVYANRAVYEVQGDGYKPEGRFFQNGAQVPTHELVHSRALRELLYCAHACNNARLEQHESAWKIAGDPTEGALLALAARAGIHAMHQRIHLNPFESVRKRMSVVVQIGSDGSSQRVVYCKGAPVELLERCSFVQIDEERCALDGSRRAEIQAQIDDFSRQGLRVLGLAMRADDAHEAREASADYSIDAAESRLVFLGLAAMSDPVRPGVPEAVRACHAAGIRVIMITGDYPLTAESIAREIGIGADRPAIAGAELAELSDAELKAVLARGEPVFARVNPAQKLRIVTLLKEAGEIVAVTGDGVNDGPALKRADAGIAMGRRGTDVAREAAQIILLDDNFASIVAAIEEGRAIFENIKRFCGYIFSSNPQELYPYVIWMLFPGMPLAMTVMGVLAVDVGTDLLPAMGLGLEPPEKDVMERPPRRPDETLLSLPFILQNYLYQGTVLSFACYATYYFFAWRSGLMANGFSFFAAPASPVALNMAQATPLYLQSLAAYFFPTVTTQIANAMCRRSRQASLFSREFMTERRRTELLDAVAGWRPRLHHARVRVEYDIGEIGKLDAARAPAHLLSALLLLPVKYLRLSLSRALVRLERPLIGPVRGALVRLLAARPLLLNLFSNPMINLGAAFSLALSAAFFYTALSEIYFFAPLSWEIYLFAFHGAFLLLGLEEGKKWLRRRGHPLKFLG